jgi:hypothetical protein
MMRSTLFNEARIVSKAGFVLTLLGLLIPAAVDLIAGGLGPPLFVPVVGVGMVMLAVGNRGNSQAGSLRAYLLLLMGLLQLFALAIPTNLFGYGYRISGMMVHFLVGLGWIIFGIRHFSRERA